MDQVDGRSAAQEAEGTMSESEEIAQSIEGIVAVAVAAAIASENRQAVAWLEAEAAADRNGKAEFAYGYERAAAGLRAGKHRESRG